MTAPIPAQVSTQVRAQVRTPGPLRRLLRLDALTCLACGLLLGLGADALAVPLGLPAALLLGAGLALFPCAALMLLASERAASRPLVLLIVAGNWAWVAASLLVLVLGAPTPLGGGFVLVQAAVVAVFAWAEGRAAAQAPRPA